tara:strand:+ start:544 stop:2199 length:1656 start_codon:yes stop_codon:yes gene_type:complete
MDRNTLLAFLLISLVLVFTPKYLEIVSPKSTEKVPEKNTNTVSNTQQAPGTQNNAPPAKLNPVNDTAIKENTKEALTEIKTDLYTALISNLAGGSIKEFHINQHTTEDGSRVNLINNGKNYGPLLLAKDLDGNIIDLASPWNLDSHHPSRTIRTDITLTYKKEIYENKFIFKHLTFHPGSYTIDISVDYSSVQNDLFREVELWWVGGLSSTEKNKKEDQTYFKTYALQGGELEELKADSEKETIKTLNGSTSWIATRTKYFTAALLPSSPNMIKKANLSGLKDIQEIYNMGVSYDPREALSFSLYLGPLEYDKIQNLGVGLDEIMDFGWAFIRPISKGVLYVLTEMYLIIPNYGYVLILFSFLIKLLVYPLTKKSYQSTSAMQALQPEISALKEKHKSNPQKLNQATMELYKKRGVNPLGGCLPMLLQMPLLFALFIVFRTTIELRAKPFIWWITDLSLPDKILDLPFEIPIYGAHVAALPILMVVSMFIQQKMMAGPSQQQQQKMMQYMMSFFFFFIFNSFPSGLNLYYTLFNILTIAQQKLIPPETTKE